MEYSKASSPSADDTSDIEGNALYLVPPDSKRVVFIFPLPVNLSYSKTPLVESYELSFGAKGIVYVNVVLPTPDTTTEPDNSLSTKTISPAPTSWLSNIISCFDWGKRSLFFASSL